MVASEESQNSCHFSMSPLNFLNSRLGNRMLVFNFGMSAFPASLLSFSSSIYFTFSSIFILFTLVWASNSILLFLGLVFPVRFFLGYVTCPFQSHHLSPFVSLCFFVPSPIVFLFPSASTVFLFILDPLYSVKSLVVILSVLL